VAPWEGQKFAFVPSSKVGFALLQSRKMASLKCHSQMGAHRYNAFLDQNTLTLLLPHLSIATTVTPQVFNYRR
jgi:hypothetical protein